MDFLNHLKYSYFNFPFFFRIIHLVRTQMFRKTNISYPLVRTRTCAYQGVRNISFSGYFPYPLNEWFLQKYRDVNSQEE